MEASFRREQHISTSAQAGEESERRDARRGFYPIKKATILPDSTTLMLFLLTTYYLVLCTRSLLGKIHRNSKTLFCSFWYRLHIGRPVSQRVKALGLRHGQGEGRRSSSAVEVVVYRS